MNVRDKEKYPEFRIYLVKEWLNMIIYLVEDSNQTFTFNFSPSKL